MGEVPKPPFMENATPNAMTNRPTHNSSQRFHRNRMLFLICFLLFFFDLLYYKRLSENVKKGKKVPAHFACAGTAAFDEKVITS